MRTLSFFSWPLTLTVRVSSSSEIHQTELSSCAQVGPSNAGRSSARRYFWRGDLQELIREREILLEEKKMKKEGSEAALLQFDKKETEFVTNLLKVDSNSLDPLQLTARSPYHADWQGYGTMVC